MRQVITIQRVWYGKDDYKIKDLKSSPAGTIKEWKSYARKHKLRLKVDKRIWQ
jgi:hypothetical protein